MAVENKKISELPTIPAVNSTLQMEVNRGGNSEKMIMNQVEGWFVQSSAGAPITTPDFVGQMHVNTTDNIIYIATGTASSADWIRSSFPEKYETAWLLNELGGAGVADWSNVHLGDDPTNPADNITHNLNTPLRHLLVKLFISTDGTDANSFEIMNGNNEGGGRRSGWTIFQVDNDNFIFQTGQNGVALYAADVGGTITNILGQNWWYKIIVYKMA